MSASRRKRFPVRFEASISIAMPGSSRRSATRISGNTQVATISLAVILTVPATAVERPLAISARRSAAAAMASASLSSTTPVGSGACLGVVAGPRDGGGRSRRDARTARPVRDGRLSGLDTRRSSARRRARTRRRTAAHRPADALVAAATRRAVLGGHPRRAVGALALGAAARDRRHPSRRAAARISIAGRGRRSDRRARAPWREHDLVAIRIDGGEVR